MRAHQIMTRQVITVRPDASIVEAAKIMLGHHISGLPLVDEAGRLVGIVSEGDFLRRQEIGTPRRRARWLQLLLGPGHAATEFVHEHGRKVRDIMTADPKVVDEDTALADVVQQMEQNGIKRLPVTRGEHIVGIVTRKNRKTSGSARPFEKARRTARVAAAIAPVIRTRSSPTKAARERSH